MASASSTRAIAVAVAIVGSMLVFINCRMKKRRRREQSRNKIEEFRGQPRLPKFAVPKSYDICLKPDFSARKFTGSVDIELDIVGDTKFIVLNAAQLSISPVSLLFIVSHSSKVLLPFKHVLFEEDEILVLAFAELLPIGIGVLSIKFEGILNDQTKGFFGRAYMDNDTEKNIAFTEFQPADARRCFPCWDEPALKATFKITLIVPSEIVALSNMPVIQERVEWGLKTVSFQESPKMSTYLVAVVVGFFEYVEDSTSDGVIVRVYCQVGKRRQAEFALRVAVRTLHLYKEYFAMAYPLPKLDMVAIPVFATGAMENYGLITFNETALLYDQSFPAVRKQRVVILVAHEVAHQWFGDLVTMEWWNQLWLKEGFATWVSYLATDSLFPEWKIWNQFLDESAEALRLDGLAPRHPIEMEINRANDIKNFYDAVTQKKGACVIRMLQSYLGAERFQRSIASCIRKYADSSASSEDLWAILEEGSGEPVTKLMNSWSKQKGYPVVSVKLKDQTIMFEQSQFLSSGDHGDGQWIVPITWCCSLLDVPKNFLLQKQSETLDIKEFLSGKTDISSAWIKFNVDQTGFYRVKYDEELTVRLRNAVENKYVSAADRFGILDDSFALCMARQQSLCSLLILMSAYKKETEHIVLFNLIKISHKVATIVADATPDLVHYVEQFFISLFEYSALKLGWEPKQGENELDAKLRGEILTTLAVFGHEGTLNEAIGRFLAFLDDRDTPFLSPDVRKAAYVAVMRGVSTSNRRGYEYLLTVYEETRSREEKIRIQSSLTYSPDPKMVLEALIYLLSRKVRGEDVVLGVSVSREGREIAWTWLKDNWEYISEAFRSRFQVTRLVNAIVSQLTSFEKAREIEEFFASRAGQLMDRILKQSLERVHINAKLVLSVQKEEHLAKTVEELA